MWTSLSCWSILCLTWTGLTGTARFHQSQKSGPETVHKRCVSGLYSPYPNSGWRDGKAFCQRTGLGRSVEEETDWAAAREGIPGPLLLDGSWKMEGKDLPGSYSQLLLLKYSKCDNGQRVSPSLILSPPHSLLSDTLGSKGPLSAQRHGAWGHGIPGHA